MKAKAEWTARTEEPVAPYCAIKRGNLIGIGSSAKHQGQRSYQTALTGRRHDCTRPAKLKHRLNHLAKRAPSRHYGAAEIIAHAVWLYLRFPLSLRMVEDLLAARGIIVSHQTVRLWAEKFGRRFANDIRRKSKGRLGDKWYLDEVVISIGGKKHWLWRAVDQDGFVLDVLVQSRRNTKAAKRLMRKLLKGQGQAPRVVITDKLRSYSAAKRDIMPDVEHRSHKGLNNRAENSHQPTRRRERIMKGFKSARHLQRFVSIHDPVANLFHIPRHDIPSHHHRELRTAAMQMWSEIARLQAV